MESPHGTLQRGTLEVRKDDFWEAISSNYDYLMNDELIASCREASGELALNEAGVSPPCETLSFAEFVQQFNLLHDWLHRLQSSMLDCDPERKSEMAALVRQELRQRETSLQLFAEEAQGLGALHPSMKEEVGRRVNLLSNKWDAVERAVDPDKDARAAPTQAFQEVAHEMRCLRRWLKELEARLPNQMAVSSSWSVPEIQDRLQAQQALQQEIESRSRLVKSLLRQCEALCTGVPPDSAEDPRQTTEGDRGPPGGGDGARGDRRPTPFFPNDAQRIRRVASNLEKRWHALWLRSLEWQCLLEQLLHGSQVGALDWDAGSEVGYGDEPRTKQPRLSCDGAGSAMMHPPLDPPLPTDHDGMESEHEEVLHALPSPPTHLEKGVMVGSTAITELKVSCKGRRLEILHDVGYSSESSTQLSSEDCIRVYSYSPESSLFREYRDGLPSDGPGTLPFLTPEEEEEEYQASPLVQSGNADFYKMTSLEEAAFSDQNGPCEEDPPPGEEGQRSGRSSARVQEWLETCEAPVTAAREEEEEGPVDSSCDASGEYTTNDESEDCHESDGADSSPSSEGLDTSRSVSLLSKSGTGSVETVVQVGASSALSEGDFVPRVVLRNGGGRKKRLRERPWSVTEVGQPGALQLSSHSTSETALNVLLATCSSSKVPSGRPRTCSVGVQKDPPSPERRQRRTRGLRGGLRSGSSSEGAPSGASSAQKRPSSQEGGGSGRRVRRSSATSRSTGGSLHNISSSSGTDNYQDCLGVAVTPSPKGHLSARTPTLAHVEEQSSVSDQVWDDYQDPPYFSEPYSEQTADEDQVKKLLDFGDDYWAFIGSPSDDTASLGPPRRDIPRRSPHRTRPTAKSGGTELDSDSDMEDLQHLLSQSGRAHAFIRNTLRKMALAGQEPQHQRSPSPRDKMSPPKFAELVATCQTNLHWLKMIRFHLHAGEDSPQLQKLISQWEALVAELQGGSTTPKSSPRLRRQSMSDASTEQQRADVLRSIGALREELTSVSELVQRPKEGCTSHAEHHGHHLGAVEQRAQELKVALSSLNDIRDSLVEVKAKAHRLATEGSVDPVAAALGDHIQALHRQWSSAYQQSGAQLSELQMTRSRATDALAPADLQGNKSVSLGSQMLDSAVAGQCGEMTGGVTRAPGRGRDVPAAEEEEKLPPGGSSGSRRLWRVLKAALPVQVALLLMYCVACLMEPHCCDLLNNFHASFGPQLRYTQGPPPV
ncbi:uncharacterized protein LOC8042354 [Ixodes scapularis]|uniref:uncharacterized protein LOC8042354 n=1 Tax=Ixodes scapularis TaxID=6945 RepID=UPI001C3891D3|nr:uncharacterized protein LOC8042354 [Ixodes scapularis]